MQITASPKILHHVTIAASVYLNKQLFSKGVISQVKETLTYKNPKWIQAKALGFSTYNIPPEIKTYQERTINDIAVLKIPRGEVAKIWSILMSEPSFLERAGAKDWQTANVPSPDLSYTNEDFKLSEYQERCVAAIVGAKQGIIHAATSTGKSAVIMAAIGLRKQKTLIIVNRKSLLHQLKGCAERWLNVPIGKIGDGAFDIQDVTIGIDKSVESRLRDGSLSGDTFGTVFVDEVHTAAVPTMQYIMESLSAEYRYGLSGTLKRKDGFQFMVYAQFGTVIVTVDREELEDAGRVSPVDIAILETDIVPSDALEQAETPSQVWKICDQEIHASEARLHMIANWTEKILDTDPHAKVAITWRYLDPCYRLMLALKDLGIDTAIVTGKEDQEEELHKIKSGVVRVVVATIPCFSTGIDIPDLTDLILASPVFTNELLLKQLRGRLMRTAEGKVRGVFHVVFDPLFFEQRKLKNCLRFLNK